MQYVAVVPTWLLIPVLSLVQTGRSCLEDQELSQRGSYSCKMLQASPWFARVCSSTTFLSFPIVQASFLCARDTPLRMLHTPSWRAVKEFVLADSGECRTSAVILSL